MLPRLPVVKHPRAHHAAQFDQRRHALPVSLRRWLTAPGSLTARLRLHGHVTVEVQSQGRQRLWLQERLTLGATEGYVREVVLRIDGRPAVWARSTTTLRAVKGPWRAIKGLGTRPLAELLFADHHVQRDPLSAEAFMRQSPQRRHLARQWDELASTACSEQGSPSDEAPTWARRSVFWHRGHPLQVMETFAPWVIGLSAGPGRRR